MSDPGQIAIAVAPMRISLAGGGTDLPSYAERFGGTVIALAIDRCVAVAVSPSPREDLFEHLGDGFRIGHEKLMGERFAAAAVRRAGARAPHLACVSTAPPRSGLGGSGSFLVALSHALRADRPPSAAVLAAEASAVEIEDLGRSVGRQDAYIAALGGLQLLRFGRDGRVKVASIPVGDRLSSYLAEHLLLFDTGVTRDAGTVLAAQDRQTRSADRSTLDSLGAIHSLVAPMLEAVRAERVDEIGPILDRHWRCKAGLSEAVAVPRVDALYRLALRSGADGGKLLGAGGGGFVLLSCRPGRQRRVRAAMAAAGATELRFGLSRSGSRLRRVSADGEAVAAVTGRGQR